MRRRIFFHNKGRSWSKQDLTILRNEFIKGTSIKDIAHKLSRNDDAVVYRLIKIGILGYPRDGEGKNNGLTWSESEKNRLLKEHKDGVAIEDIAKKHGRNRNAILFQLIQCRAFDFTNRTELEKYLHEDSAELVGTNDNDVTKSNGGYSKMGFERMAFNTTKSIPTKGSNILSGRPDAIFLRNKYQKEVDNSWAALVNMVHYVEEESQKLRSAFNKAQGAKQDIKAHEAERADLFDSLGNLLKKETDFEDKMWKTTQKGRKVKSITVKQKFKDSEVDEMRFDSIMDYIKQYPEYTSKSSFKKLLDKIEQKEKEIREAKKEYNDSVSKYNYYLSFFEKHLQKAEDKASAYKTVLAEGKEVLNESRYKKSIAYKFAPEEVKAEVNIDTLSHDFNKVKNTLQISKKEFAKNQTKEFVEMEY